VRRAKRFVLQHRQIRFGDWQGWASSHYKTIELHGRSRGWGDYRTFTAEDLLQNPPPPGYEFGVLYLRVVPVDAEGNLAGLPS